MPQCPKREKLSAATANCNRNNAEPPRLVQHYWRKQAGSPPTSEDSLYMPKLQTGSAWLVSAESPSYSTDLRWKRPRLTIELLWYQLFVRDPEFRAKKISTTLRIFSGYLKPTRLYFLVLRLFELTSKLSFKIRVKWQFSGLFFEFRVISNSEGYLLKIFIKDS